MDDAKLDRISRENTHNSEIRMKDIIIGGLEGIHNGTHRAWRHCPQLIMVGHNLVNDMTILDRLKILQHFNLIGVADTQVTSTKYTHHHILYGRDLTGVVLYLEVHTTLETTQSQISKSLSVSYWIPC